MAFHQTQRRLRHSHTCHPPQNLSKMPRLLGMANYCACFIPYISSTTQPLWDLSTLKGRLVNNLIMGYLAIVDGGPVSLWVILAQIDKSPKKHALWHMPATHSNPLNRDSKRGPCKSLGVSLFRSLYSAQVNMITGHKPLKPIFNNPKSKPPAWIET